MESSYMRVNTKTLKIILLFLIVSFIPIQITQSLVLGDTLYSYPEDVPVIDGLLEVDIWQFSRKLDIKLYSFFDQENILYLSIMAVYNEANGSLTLGVTIPDDGISTEFFGIAFKTNVTHPLVYFDNFWRYSMNNDIKLFYPHLNSSDDGVTYDIGIGGFFDIPLGGFNNTFGRSTHTGSQYTFELTTPLDSGDTAGKDFSLAKKDKIDFFIFYTDDSEFYSQIRIADGDYDYCTLVIGKKGLLGPSTFFIVASLVASLAVIAYVSRKRK